MMVVRPAMSAELIQSASATDRGYSDAICDREVMNEDDREEGEIVDDYEVIISSEDEEFKLRARIQQLEENNKDVERMDMLAANLANQYNYPELEERTVRLPRKSPVYLFSDVSSYSDNDYDYDSQRNYHRSRLSRVDTGRRLLNGDHKRSTYARRYKPQYLRSRQLTPSYKNYHLQKSTHHHHYQEQDALLLHSFDRFTDDEIREYDVTSENEGEEVLDLERLKLSRDKLRVALAREERNDMLGKYRNSLRERLQYPLRKSPKDYPANKGLLSPPVQQLPDVFCLEEGAEANAPPSAPSPRGDPAELSLRLIALKSAIIKKHMARKKRDAERAYSPTDMINRVHPTVSYTDEIDDLMEISPAASPEREPNPFRCHTEDAVNTKPVDMDLAETDSDEQKGPWNTWANNWNSFDRAGGSWRCFMPNSSLPPVSMPIVIDSDDDLYDDEEPPPPPPFHNRPIHLDEDARDAMHLVDEQNSNHSSLTYTQSVSMENTETQTKSFYKSQTPETSDDEAGALRAMLLSNLKTAKEAKPTRIPLLPTPGLSFPPALLPPLPVPAPTLAVSTLKSDSIGSSDSDDPEQLRSLLLSSIATKKGSCFRTIKSRLSPEILKNAVRRFQSCAFVAPSKEDKQSQDDNQPIGQPQDDSQPIVQPQDDNQPIVQLQDDNQPIEQPQDDSQPIVQPQDDIQPIVQLQDDNQPIEQPQDDIYQIEGAEKIEQEVPSQHLVEAAFKSQDSNQSSIGPQPESSHGSSKDMTIQKSPCAKIIKIVKPNKVINKKSTTKRKLSTEEPSSAKLSCTRPSTLLVTEPLNPLKVHASSPVTRLVTNIDSASIKVSKMIISLADDSAASDDNLELSSCFGDSNYTENASPLSLAMGSPSGSTTRSNTPNSEILESTPASTSTPNLRRSVMSEYFEKKIDDYLKQARSKVPTPGTNGTKETKTDKPTENTSETERLLKNPPKVATIKPQQTKKTPLAVRHLPVASQKEYLRLIERMQLLEQKKLKTAKKAKAAGKATTAALGKAPTTNGPSQVVQKAAIHSSSSKAAGQQAAGAGNKTKVKTIVKPIQPPRESRLKSFENSFARIGGSMIANLEKSMQLVEEAKKSKAVRMRGSHRLKELYSEMQAVRQVVQQEELKLARIQPEIQTTHQIILSLNQKRNKLYAAAMDLGKGLRGDDYRLLDEGKAEIRHKSTQLSKQIRLYNSIVKYDDLKKLTKEQQPLPLPPAENESQPPLTAMEPQSARVDQSSRTASEAARESEANGISTDTAIVARSEPPPPEKATESEAQLMPDNQPLDEPDPKSKPEPVYKLRPGPYTVGTMRELREEEAASVRDTYLPAYRSIMPRNYSSPCDVHATICPFELMGRCEDADCSYLHLGRL
ncbi:uncharacterized protein LOC117185756 [Drosophila miranda]|uniref:uncharacterized protein LOC117185756 n=1 Tax=Drosophila miranda TaxID=7229 RepID=UPI0007E72D98|nr:uncharacterized protein LOC117185756 [Drosophila miranda]